MPEGVIGISDGASFANPSESEEFPKLLSWLSIPGSP